MNHFIILAFTCILLSFKFNPMSQTLELSDNNKSSQFTIENDTSEKMAIELTVRQRVMDQDGKETLPETNDLSIFPPQIIIPPKEKRTIRVLWNGPKKIEVEKSYRVIAEQLPLNIDKKKKGTGIQMLMKYMAAFYVSPENAEANVSLFIDSVKNNEIKLKAKNSGNSHQIFYRPKLTFKKDSKKWIFNEKELIGLSGENILSNSERYFTIKSAKKIPQDAEVTFKIEE